MTNVIKVRRTAISCDKKMASETVVAAKILCEARSRQKLRELHVGQNFQQQNFNQNQALPSPLTARPQGIHSMKFSLILNFFM